MKKLKYVFAQLMLIVCLVLAGCSQQTYEISPVEQLQTALPETETLKDDKIAPDEKEIKERPNEDEPRGLVVSDIPKFSGEPYVVINNNQPLFGPADFTTQSVELYADLDNLGRAGVAFANIGKDLMPTEERGSIGQVKPSGWHTVKYDHVDGKYLYNRCHLIGFQLTAENANEKNLITGTRYMNVQGMLPFENMVADYIKETNNHVLYRVIPIYEGENLVAGGVTMEAISVEDNGEGICFYVFIYNNQPGVTIDYATGESQIADGQADTSKTEAKEEKTDTPKIEYKAEQTVASETKAQAVQAKTATYILNTSTRKFHEPSCSSVKKMKDVNKESFTGAREDLIDEEYSPCKICNP